MATKTCGYCGTPTHMTIEWYDLRTRDDGLRVLQAVIDCDTCHVASVANLPRPTGYPVNNENADRLIINEGPVYWSPEHVSGRDFPDVPEKIASVADEAHRSASIGANRGAILLARTAIDATAKDKGIKDGMLRDNVDELADEGHVRKSIADAAHEVRHFGNDMAHGDIDVETTNDDAAEVLELMALVLQEVYQTPARVGAAAAKRAAKKAATASGAQ